MSKICVSAALAFSRRSLISAGLLLGILTLNLSAFAASNQANATLHIQVVVIPTVQAASASLPMRTSIQDGSAMYSLQPSSATNMTYHVTLRQLSSDELDGGPVSSPSAGRTVLVQTTTIVAQ